ncbi:MAG: alpha/beta fold hydrolase [Silicimonas sp.]|nr:alpha/beta fold hydrolase [Silicimonas sp.]
MRPVRFVATHDDLSLAWTRSGTGPPLVKASAWLTHLEYDAESPVWSHWLSFFEAHFDYLRYDERGCGLSDRATGQLDIESWTDDLTRVIDAATMPEPFVLLAMSQGTGAAVRYAVRYPERVSHLVLIGGYARGAFRRGDEKGANLYRAVVDIFGTGFDHKNPAFREVFTKRFLPHGDPEKIQWFNDLCRRTVDAETGARLLDARGKMDVSASLSDVTCPTLVIHARDDGVAPLSEGRFLAQHIPGAVFHVLDSPNHILQPDEPAWAAAKEAILKFVGAETEAGHPDLTPREQAILEEICAAKSNKDIARTLGVSEKTVRNHATRIFAKLGVATRQEAILKMQDRR